MIKPPDQCQNLQEIREAIDSLDQDIIDKFGKRFEYVKAAAKYKQNQEEVRASDRFKLMLQQRRVWAAANNLNPDVIEQLYRDLVNYFVSEELQHWDNQE